MPEANRPHQFIVPAARRKPCAHYFVTAADGRRRFCVHCGRYHQFLLKEEERASNREPPAPPGPEQGTR